MIVVVQPAETLASSRVLAMVPRSSGDDEGARGEGGEHGDDESVPAIAAGAGEGDVGEQDLSPPSSRVWWLGVKESRGGV